MITQSTVHILETPIRKDVIFFDARIYRLETFPIDEFTEEFKPLDRGIFIAREITLEPQRQY